jgi:hypothetical protein
MGGTGDDECIGVALDISGNAYVTGRTTSHNFPVTGGAFQTTFAGREDAFFVKLGDTGGAFYSTYLGGSGYDIGTGIAVDLTGVYVTGSTTSSDFPTKHAIQAHYHGTGGFGSADAFVTKFSPAGKLAFSTYLGGRNDDRAVGIAVDPFQTAYIAGNNYDGHFPTTSGAFQTTSAGGEDAFVARIAIVTELFNLN